jgi:hypothetical protein
MFFQNVCKFLAKYTKSPPLPSGWSKSLLLAVKGCCILVHLALSYVILLIDIQSLDNLGNTQTLERLIS